MTLFHRTRWLLATLLVAWGFFVSPAWAVEFGDDLSVWSNDGECDDPRFTGPGVAASTEAMNLGHDATDCEMLFNAGQIELIQGEKSPGGSDTPASDDARNATIDFGDDTSLFANDGECDDMRFVGEYMAIELIEIDRGHDASDCRSLFEDGLIMLKPAPDEVVGAIDFGDDSSEWSNDNECDDPRFDGPGAAEALLDENLARDATDCRNLFLAGEVVYLGDDPSMQTISADGIDFGDNTSTWSNDSECDDPRFEGTGMAEQPSGANLGHDANDCLALYESDSIYLIGSATLENNDAGASGIDFGDDEGEWPNDGECDDPRFEGPGMTFSEYLSDVNTGHDASDCRMHFISGQITLIGGTRATPNMGSVDFGDDTGTWPNDGECDDIRFEGPGMADGEFLSDENIGRDASDCQDLYRSGDVTLVGAIDSDIDFGDDSGTWPDDGECDDIRFTGPGMASDEFLTDDNVARDATDCQRLFGEGQVELAESQPEEFNGLYDGIDFGDNQGGWPNDGECDDMRFEGPGMALADSLSDQNIGHDASDCMDLYQAGDVQLAGAGGGGKSGGTAIDTSAIDFGDDAGDWPDDGECDDMRFVGDGMAAAATLEEQNIGHDATDCQALFQSGSIQVAHGQSPTLNDSGIDFGDDSSDWADDGECDDPRFSGPGMAYKGTLSDENIGHDATDCRYLFNTGGISLL